MNIQVTRHPEGAPATLVRNLQRLSQWFFGQARAIDVITSRINPVLMVVSSLLIAPSSRAAYSNYNSVLIGSRAAGLGGAFTALSEDTAASPFYNPATTILSHGNSLSATVNVYNRYSTTIGENADFREAPQRLNQGYFRSLPSSSATILGFGSFAAGLTIIVPDYQFYSGQIRGSDDTSSFLNLVDESLWVGGTFSARLTDRDRVGFSLYYTARNLSRTANDRVTSAGGTGATVTTEEKNVTANSFVTVFGYHRQLSSLWSFGISYRPPSLPIAGEGTYYRETISTTPYSASTINRGNLRAITKIPSKLSVGFAREAPKVNTLSLDLQFYEAISYFDLPEVPEGADQVVHRPIVNFALGYEQVIEDWVSVRFAVFSNLSSHPDPQLDSGYRQGDHVDMNGFAANTTFKMPSGTHFTFGGYYTAGQGSSIQRVGQKLSIMPKTEQVFTMLVATGFAF